MLFLISSNLLVIKVLLENFPNVEACIVSQKSTSVREVCSNGLRNGYELIEVWVWRKG
jgi:hypothetical protein